MKKIVLVPNLTKDSQYTYTKQAAALLLKNGFSVATDESLSIPVEGIEKLPYDKLFDNATAILVLGGDGSILRIVETAAKFDLPILAINLGRLGYIAQLEKCDLDKLPDILASDFKTESRAMLSVSLYRRGTAVFENKLALNDAVITKAFGHGIIEFDLFCNGEKISYYRGDGMIASTATGSTAYAMSAGGAVIDSTLRLIEVTPICAHSLNARPIVFSESSELFAVIHDSPNTSCVTLDGNETTPLEAGDKLTITLSSQVTKLVSVKSSFYQVLYRKMSDL